MIARRCTSETCRTISQHFTCPLCDSPTLNLPELFLGPIGLDVKASLRWSPKEKYFLLIDKPSGPARLPIQIRDIRYNTQPNLPNFEPATGLQIMDYLKDLATIIAQREPTVWCGWVTYLIEALQAHTNEVHYQALLQALIEELRAKRLHE